MNVLTNTSFNRFIKVKDVKIPEYFNRRFFTNKPDLDLLFGGSGIVPNFTFTLAAAPGTGKTTFLLQTLELLEMSGKKTAYISGEETIEQLAFTSKRIGVSNVPLANITDIDDICNLIVEHKFDFVVIDSLPALTTKQKLNKNQKDEYITTKLLATAKTNEIAIGIVLHFTKTGSYKGSTLLPHSVDCNMLMRRNEDVCDLRDIEVTKNRFGSCSFSSFPLTNSGFVFQTAESNKQNTNKQITNSKKNNILQQIGETPKTIIEIVKETQISASYATILLRDLLIEGKIKKEGKGCSAVYTKL